MKNSLLYLIVALAITCTNVFSQIIFTMKPDACRGKDARVIAIAGLTAPSNTNYGTHPYFEAATWTFNDIGGGTGYIHSFIDFADLQSIPQGAIISSASLTLYGVPTSHLAPLGNYGSNDCWLERVTSTWAENTVTWNSHPTTTTTNRVTIPGTTSWNVNRTMNVQTLVQDMINLPASQRYGFGMKLKDENIYRWLTFASSDHSDASLHPKLEVTFTYCPSGARSATSGIIENYTADNIDEAQLKRFENNTFPVTVSPNPAKEDITIEYELPSIGTTTVSLISQATGHVLKTLEVDGSNGKHLLRLPLDKTVPKGSPILVQIKQNDTIVTKRIIISE